MENSRNLVITLVLCAVLLFGWEAGLNYLYPEREKQPVAAASASTAPSDAALPADDGAASPADEKQVKRTREGGLTDPDAVALEQADLKTDLASTDRVKIAAPEIAGSINPVGARIDDVVLKTHRQSVEKDSGPVRLFSPAGTPAQQFAQFGWVGDGVKLPDANTVWHAEGGPLAPGTPVTLSWANGQGQTFRIRLSVDERYMVTAEQTMANTGAAPVVVQPFALINRTSKTASQDTWTIHSGPIGAFSDTVSTDWNYSDVEKAGKATPDGKAQWIGFTDIYWLSALIPDAGANPQADFRSLGKDIFRADLIYQPATVQPGKQFTRTTRLFVGAKESEVLDAYQDAGVTKFGLAIDWGWFRFFEVPIFWLLKKLFALTGNFGFAIILLTVIVRGMMFPVAQRQFASMAAMRAVQPKMKAIQERYKDDKAKQQEAIMALYKEEKINPLAGCLPLLLQIPVFFALYKVLMLTIEMRHKPFVLWIHDLSAPDPAHVLNLFGLLPFDVPSMLAIGPLALLLGLTMWMTFRLNPTAMDPIQQQMFSIMPWVLMFVMAPFAAGLLVYWVTSNLLTVAQQTYLYSKHPQLKAQAAKDKDDRARDAARDKG
ncbi:MAG: membrane protein insertase YidC [Sphingomonadales bacterium]|nr:membrane protein insertase YidC [Sphingomonadales bacterium]MBD3772141.1 membrane protein insertase YidC [Paracoccaceae bacterium]